MGEVDYVVYPWFVPTLLFEWSDDQRFGKYSVDNPQWHLVAAANFVVVANVRAYANVEVGPFDPTPGQTRFDFLSANLGVSMGF